MFDAVLPDDDRPPDGVEWAPDDVLLRSAGEALLADEPTPSSFTPEDLLGLEADLSAVDRVHAGTSTLADLDLVAEIWSADAAIARQTARRARAVAALAARRKAPRAGAGTAPGVLPGADSAARQRDVLAGVDGFFSTELALIRGCSEADAERLTADSLVLTRALPDTLAAMEAGQVAPDKADVYVDLLGHASPGTADAVQRALLPATPGLTRTRLRERMRRRLLRLEPDALEQRRTEAQRRADVRAYPTSDGMGVLAADLPIHGAVACREMVDALAKLLRADGDERPIGVLRGVALMDLVLRPEAARPPVTVPLTVHAWLPSLRRPEVDGAGQEPGEVGGHVVSAAQCREILTELGALGVQRPPAGSLHVAVHDPATGDLVAVATTRELERAAFGRRTRRRRRHAARETAPADGPGLRPPPATSSYRPTAAQRRHVRVRDRRCRAFGCARPAESCDADHVHPHAEGGATECLNLCSLCRRHHRVKTHGRGWRFEVVERGRLRITTPSGVSRVMEHPGRVHADVPDGPEDEEQHPRDPASP